MSDQQYSTFQHYGTAAERGAFTPDPSASIQPVYIWYETDTGDTYLFDTTWHQIAGAGSSSVLTVLAADPGAPVDGTGWLVASGVSPTRTIALKVRDAGVTYTVASITV